MDVRNRTLVFVGCLNRPAPYFAGAHGEGIATLSFDEATGLLTPLAVTRGIDNPTGLAVDPVRRMLYATSEVFGWNEGTVTSYVIDGTDDVLHYRNKQPTLGSITSYCSLDRTGHHLLVANYGHETADEHPRCQAALLPILADRSLGYPASAIAYAGSGPVLERQPASHAHCILSSPDNRFVLVADLGVDKVFSYPFDTQAPAFGASAASSVTLPPGSGPRHLVFHPNGRFLYLVSELTCTVTMFAYDAKSGVLDSRQTVSTLPTGTRSESHAADLQISPHGHFLYASNRGHDSIAMYSVDADSGRLDLASFVPCDGRTPRSLALDPSGRFLLVANQDSDDVTVFAVDAVAATLRKAARIAIGTPMCVKIARIAA